MRRPLALAMARPIFPHEAIDAHELARQAKAQRPSSCYREAIQIDPKRSDLHFELAEMLNHVVSEGRRTRPKRIRIALALDPFDEKSVCRLGDAAVRHADYVPRNLLHQALRMQPNVPEANLSLAKVLMNHIARRNLLY